MARSVRRRRNQCRRLDAGACRRTSDRPRPVEKPAHQQTSTTRGEIVVEHGLEAVRPGARRARRRTPLSRASAPKPRRRMALLDPPCRAAAARACGWNGRGVRTWRASSRHAASRGSPSGATAPAGLARRRRRQVSQMMLARLRLRKASQASKIVITHRTSACWQQGPRGASSADQARREPPRRGRRTWSSTPTASSWRHSRFDAPGQGHPPQRGEGFLSLQHDSTTQLRHTSWARASSTG